MHDTMASQQQTFPRGALLAAALLIAFAIAAALSARLGGIGASRVEMPPVVESRLLRFADGPAGSIHVIAADSGERIGTLPGGHHGFVKVVLRGLARERSALGVGSQPAFRLGRTGDGSMLIEDTATGRFMMLEAFGAGNARAFETVFQLGRNQQ